MRLLAWAVAVPVTLAVVLFTLSNRQTVTLALFPFPSTIDAPVYLVGFAGALVGFLAGGLITWLSGHRWRRRAREAARDKHIAEVETAGLKRQLAAAKRPPEAGSTEPAAAATAQAPERRLAIADATRNP
jgi:uncharacterized integral membrane protein